MFSFPLLLVRSNNNEAKSTNELTNDAVMTVSWKGRYQHQPHIPTRWPAVVQDRFSSAARPTFNFKKKELKNPE